MTNYSKTSRALVTGSAGFMGSHLVDSLIKKGFNVYGVDDLSGGYLLNVNKNSNFTKLDLRDKNAVGQYIKKIKPEIVFHLAADATEGRSQFTPLSATERNYMAYLNLLVACINNGLKKIVLTSSMSVYGSQNPPFSEDMDRKPDDIYGISKTSMERATEILSEVHGFRYTIVRPHNVYGPRQNMADPYRNVIAIFINCLLNNKNYYIYGNGTQRRAFSYINDFTPYIIKAALLKKADGEIFNIGPTKEYTINKVSNIVLNNFFDKGDVPNNKKPKNLSIRPMEVIDAWCTVDKAEKILGYKTSISLEEGIAEMVKWAKLKGPQKFIHLEQLEIQGKTAPKSWTKKLL